MLLGYVVMFLGNMYNYWICLGAALLIGMASSLGEATHYGFIRKFPRYFVDTFSAATGFSGFLGSLFYLVLAFADASNQIIFIVVTPFALIYVLNFQWLWRTSKGSNYFNTQDRFASMVDKQADIQEEGNLDESSELDI